MKRNVLLVIVMLFVAGYVQAGVVTPVDVKASSAWGDANRQPGVTIDDVGMTWTDPLNDSTLASSTHDSQSNDFWHANEPVANVWIAFDLGAEVDLKTMVVWNLHAFDVNSHENVRGLKEYNLILCDSTLDFSDPMGTMASATVASFNNLTLQQASADQFITGEVVDVADTAGVQYVIIDVISNYDGSNYAGLSAVRFTAVPEPATLTLLGMGMFLLRKRK
jgi:hypothetical protein